VAPRFVVWLGLLTSDSLGWSCRLGNLAASLTTVQVILSRMLFGLTQTDSLTFFAITALMFLVALFALHRPARRASAIDPLEVLRSE
jgi:ABC-type lipoprotein release transport system permease subunit